MKQCPNCNKVYRDFDQYCLVCGYKLKYIEGTEKIEYVPNPTGNKFTSNEIKEKPIVICPYCKSTDTKPISGTERAVSILGLGIFSKKINKSYKCLNCKCTW